MAKRKVFIKTQVYQCFKLYKKLIRIDVLSGVRPHCLNISTTPRNTAYTIWVSYLQSTYCVDDLLQFGDHALAIVTSYRNSIALEFKLCSISERINLFYKHNSNVNAIHHHHGALERRHSVLTLFFFSRNLSTVRDFMRYSVLLSFHSNVVYDSSVRSGFEYL